MIIIIIPNSLIVSLITPHPLFSSPAGKRFPSVAGTLSGTDPVRDLCWGSGREIACRAGMDCWVSFRTVIQIIALPDVFPRDLKTAF